jgi:hypothetical protein
MSDLPVDTMVVQKNLEHAAARDGHSWRTIELR